MNEAINQVEKLAYIEVMAVTILAEETTTDERFKSILQGMRDVIQDVISKPKKRDINSLYHDLSEMCRWSSSEIRMTVSEALLKKIGQPLSYFEKARIERINRIVMRGKIRTDEEWRLVEERIQELCGASTTAAECDVLDQLLWQYKPKPGV